MNRNGQDLQQLADRRKFTHTTCGAPAVFICLLLSKRNYFSVILGGDPAHAGADVGGTWLNTVSLSLLLPMLTIYSAQARRFTIKFKREDKIRRAATHQLLGKLKSNGHRINPDLETYLMKYFDARDLERGTVKNWETFIRDMEKRAMSVNHQKELS